MPAVLTSRWGFAPVVVATASDVEDSSPSGSREDSIISSIIHASSGDCASDETGMSAATGTPPNSLMTVHVAASAPPAGTPLPQSLLPLDENSGDSKEDEEPTGGMLWDCAKVLYDLLADPSATNEFSIKGKVRSIVGDDLSFRCRWQVLFEIESGAFRTAKPVILRDSRTWSCCTNQLRHPSRPPKPIHVSTRALSDS